VYAKLVGLMLQCYMHGMGSKGSACSSHLEWMVTRDTFNKFIQDWLATTGVICPLQTPFHSEWVTEIYSSRVG
jgi:hypothetical protein